MSKSLLLYASLCTLAVLLGAPAKLALISQDFGNFDKAIIAAFLTTMACLPMGMFWFHWTQRYFSLVRKGKDNA